MTHIDPGQYGAKRATWRDANPRRTLREIIQANRAANEGVWRQEFWEQVKGETSELRAVVEYWLDNNIRSLIGGELADQPQRRRRRQERDQKVRSAKAQLETIIFLNLTCPNGKPLRDCTGAECRRFGGWYQKLAERVPARKHVGDVLNEAEVKKIWATTR